MENNSTKAVLKPTQEERVAIFGPYIGCPCSVNWNTDEIRRGNLSMVRWNGDAEIQDESDFFSAGPIEDFTLEVKPLGGISDEDWLDYVKMRQPELDWDNELRDLAVRQRLVSIAKEYSQTSRIFVDFMRSRGYALPYGPWSVEQLVEFGIFKLVEDGTNGK